MDIHIPGPAVVDYREEGAGATDEREVRLVSNPGMDVWPDPVKNSMGISIRLSTE